MHRIIRDPRGRELVKFETPSGVTAWVATSVSSDALNALAKKLRRRLAAPRPPPQIPK